jgi:uncharacterized membrane protein
MRRILAAAAVALAGGLAACQPQSPDGKAAPPPADAPAAKPAAAPAPPPAAEPGVSLDARGTEPFWAVKIRPREILLLRPDQPPLRMSNPGPRITGEQAIWAGRAGGEPLIIAIWLHDCSDGMSDRAYPFAAEVQIGEASLKGCALKVEGAPTVDAPGS